MNLISETGYELEMKEKVLPCLKERERSGEFERVRGENIHYRIFTADAARADLVLVHGFTEGIDKFNETIFYFLEEGFNVWQIQQRGHGKSYRGVSDPSLVYIRNYQDLIEDLHYFVTEIVRKMRKDPHPLYLFGHSMGGGVSAAYLEQYPQDFQKAVLSSPMLELSAGMPMWIASLYAGVMTLLGKDKNYMPGGAPYRDKPDFENSCSNCEERYLYWFQQTLEHKEYQTSAPAIATAVQFLKLTKTATDPQNCSKVRAQVLLMQAGKDHMVLPGGQETFIRQIGGKGRLVRMENAKHEIYLCRNEDLIIYWKEVLEFFTSCKN